MYSLMDRGLIKREGGDVLGERCAQVIELIGRLSVRLMGEVEVKQERVEGRAGLDDLLKGGAEGHTLHAWDLIRRLSPFERACEVRLASEVVTLLLVELIKEVAQGGVCHRDLVALCVKGRGSRTAQGAA